MRICHNLGSRIRGNDKKDKAPIWIHGDFAIGNILMYGGKLSAVIDFGGAAVGDPACDL